MAEYPFSQLWTKLFVNLEVDRSEGPLSKLKRCNTERALCFVYSCVSNILRQTDNTPKNVNVFTTWTLLDDREDWPRRWESTGSRELSVQWKLGKKQFVNLMVRDHWRLVNVRICSNCFWRSWLQPAQFTNHIEQVIKLYPYPEVISAWLENVCESPTPATLNIKAQNCFVFFHSGLIVYTDLKLSTL